MITIPIIHQVLMQIVIPSLISWIGFEGGKFIRRKTGNKDAAAAFQRFGDVMSGAVASIEQDRHLLPTNLTPTQKDVLRLRAINEAKNAVGKASMAAIESKYGSMRALCDGLVEKEVAKVKTDRTKLK